MPKTRIDVLDLFPGGSSNGSLPKSELGIMTCRRICVFSTLIGEST